MINHIDSAIDMTAVIVEGIHANRLQELSLCPDWDIRFELNHLVGGMRIFAGELSGTPVDKDHHDDWLGTDHRAAFQTAADLDRAAWRRPDALDTTVQLGFGRVPGHLAALIHRTELLVHGADLAVVTGQEDHIDQRQCGELLDTMRGMDFQAFRRPGMFGPERPAPADAAAHRHLLAFLGRDFHVVAS
ncbi:TIGR03086 family metal-binding protein [Amycolatopsis sp. NPDC102389]|uniref:TIGR03086 family metal-binding protein n=1 Tax=Amycolatopsis sp. NPDC102389 TaxID=3363941 RepID=UPI0038184561